MLPYTTNGYIPNSKNSRTKTLLSTSASVIYTDSVSDLPAERESEREISFSANGNKCDLAWTSEIPVYGGTPYIVHTCTEYGVLAEAR